MLRGGESTSSSVSRVRVSQLVCENAWMCFSFVSCMRLTALTCIISFSTVLRIPHYNVTPPLSFSEPSFSFRSKLNNFCTCFDQSLLRDDLSKALLYLCGTSEKSNFYQITYKWYARKNCDYSTMDSVDLMNTHDRRRASRKRSANDPAHPVKSKKVSVSCVS